VSYHSPHYYSFVSRSGFKAQEADWLVIKWRGLNLSLLGCKLLPNKVKLIEITSPLVVILSRCHYRTTKRCRGGHQPHWILYADRIHTTLSSFAALMEFLHLKGNPEQIYIRRKESLSYLCFSRKGKLIVKVSFLWLEVKQSVVQDIIWLGTGVMMGLEKRTRTILPANRRFRYTKYGHASHRMGSCDYLTSDGLLYLWGQSVRSAHFLVPHSSGRHGGCSFVLVLSLFL